MTTSGLLSRFLFGVAATDTATMCSAMVVLGLAAAAAAFLPARRASGMDALIALRAE
jgi:ABC-type antimicrobial peptide transport system permease subunit